jgi:hypothetical protein
MKNEHVTEIGVRLTFNVITDADERRRRRRMRRRRRRRRGRRRRRFNVGRVVLSMTPLPCPAPG